MARGHKATSKQRLDRECGLLLAVYIVWRRLGGGIILGARWRRLGRGALPSSVQGQRRWRYVMSVATLPEDERCGEDGGIDGGGALAAAKQQRKIWGVKGWSHRMPSVQRASAISYLEMGGETASPTLGL